MNNQQPEEVPRWLDGIHGEGSRRLILSDAKVVKVLAGPGAGKTTCLKRRVIRLVESGKAQRSHIFVGTFTRVIARSLQESFAPTDHLPEGHEEERPVVATLHSHASRLLRDNPHAVQGRSFRFLLDHEEKVMLYDIATSVPQFPTHRDRSSELKKLQAQWATRGDLDDARFAGAVDTWLRSHGGMLIGEVVFLATNAIQAANLEPKRFDHVFVDEYQDLTECEQAFVDMITANDGSIVVLGDDDQSIYGFRYNHPEGITAFPADEVRRGEVETIPLPDNYRCARSIVNLANEIAAAAGSRKDPMQPALADEGRVDFVVWDTLDEEIEGLADVIGARTSNILVLVTRQFIGYRLKALVGDDAVTTFHEEVLRVPFVRERFMLGALLADENDGIALRAWLALEADSSKQASHRNVAAYQSAIASQRSGLQLLEGIADESVALSGDGKNNIKRRTTMYLEAKQSVPGDLEGLLKFLFDPDLADAMPERSHPAVESASDVANRLRLEQEDRDAARGDLDLLRRSAIQIMQAKKEPSLVSVIEELRYRIGTRAPLLDDDQVPRVRIMTLHGAKGLEEETVVVAGLADEIIPGPATGSALKIATHVAEQRRLLYVAVTRAKRELILSWSRAIPGADTFANGIVQKTPGFTRGGTYYTPLTRTSLLPAQRERPQNGREWKRSQLERDEQ